MNNIWNIIMCGFIADDFRHFGILEKIRKKTKSGFWPLSRGGCEYWERQTLWLLPSMHVIQSFVDEASTFNLSSQHSSLFPGCNNCEEGGHQLPPQPRIWFHDNLQFCWYSLQFMCLPFQTMQLHLKVSRSESFLNPVFIGNLQGGIIRQQLYELLKDEAGVHFEAGTSGSGGIRSATMGMQGSKFCLHLAGDTPSSNRLFDAIASHCVPVIISDDIELPYEDDVDFSEFCLFIKSSDALQKNFVINLLRSIGSEEWTRMWKRLQEVDHHFKYQHPTMPNDAVNMVWKAVALARSPPWNCSFTNKGDMTDRSQCRPTWKAPEVYHLYVQMLINH